MDEGIYAKDRKKKKYKSFKRGGPHRTRKLKDKKK